MTETVPESSFVPGPPRERRRRRRRGRSTPRSPRARALTAIGCVLLLVGTGILAWVGWQFWGTNWVSDRRQDEVSSLLQDGWSDGSGTVKTDWGEATALLRVPRFGKNYEVPVLEGSSDEVLAAGVGHMENTQGPGEQGNYVLAGHRITHGEPFADLPDLEPGDEVYVETRTHVYTYRLDTGGEDLVVPFTASWVLARFPKNPDGGVEPPRGVGKRLITLVTCSELFHTDNRSVVFGHLEDTVRK